MTSLLAPHAPALTATVAARELLETYAPTEAEYIRTIRDCRDAGEDRLAQMLSERLLSARLRIPQAWTRADILAEIRRVEAGA